MPLRQGHNAPMRNRRGCTCRHVAKQKKAAVPSMPHPRAALDPGAALKAAVAAGVGQARPAAEAGWDQVHPAKQDGGVCISSRRCTWQCHPRDPSSITVAAAQPQQLHLVHSHRAPARRLPTTVPMHPMQLPGTASHFVKCLTCSDRCPPGHPGPAGAHWRRLPSLRRASLFPWRVHLSSKWSALGLYAFPTTPLATGCAYRPAQPRALIH